VFPCNNRNEAVKKEREWYEILNSSLNTNYPQRTQEEYRTTNREQILVDKKEYRTENREQILVDKKEYRDNNLELIHLRSLKYREENKEAINLRKRQLYNETKHISSICECGKSVKKKEIPAHLKTLVHTRYLESIAIIEPSV
jgi:Ser-tRNA(Ala) deacylase AlaX